MQREYESETKVWWFDSIRGREREKKGCAQPKREQIGNVPFQVNTLFVVVVESVVVELFNICFQQQQQLQQRRLRWISNYKAIASWLIIDAALKNKLKTKT